jgi:hypothetical protein
VSGLRRFSQVILHPAHLRRTGFIALLVGTWLTLFNQGDVLWAGQFSLNLWIKVTLNYVTPFVVANFGLLSSEKSELRAGSERES